MSSTLNTKLTLGFWNQAFQSSPAFRALATSTQKSYSLGLDRLKPLSGLPIASVRRSDLILILDPLHGKPGAQHSFITACRAMFNYSIERGALDNNPASTLSPEPSSPLLAWRLSDALVLINKSSPQVSISTSLGLYTGQRISDILSLTWDSIDGELINVKQIKTGTRLTIPITSHLRMALEVHRAIGNGGDYVVGGPLGGPGFIASFRQRWMRERDRLGLPKAPFHGLRKCCASMLAEHGASTREIMAVGGWKSSRQVDLYTAQANQLDLARNALGRL